MIPAYTSLVQAEKDEVAKICKTMKALSERARREGVLALEDGIEDIESLFSGKNGIFMQKLLRFVIDGHDGAIITQIADNYTETSCHTDFEKLCFLLMKRGVLGIQAGENPHTLAEILVSYIGLDGEAEFREKTGFEENGW